MKRIRVGLTRLFTRLEAQESVGTATHLVLGCDSSPGRNSFSPLPRVAPCADFRMEKTLPSVTAQAAVEADQPVTSAAVVDERLDALMIRYQAGDAAAFRELFETLHRPLRAYVLSLARDAVKAEDLLQETLLQLHRARHTYCPPRPVRPWVFGIARYVFLMDRRATGRRTRVIDEGLELPAEVPIPPRAFGFADREGLRRALGKLPEDQREVLLLHHVWGFSFADIGQFLGIREGTAKVRSHRGIARLRDLLGVKGDA